MSSVKSAFRLSMSELSLRARLLAFVPSRDASKPPRPERSLRHRGASGDDIQVGRGSSPRSAGKFTARDACWLAPAVRMDRLSAGSIAQLALMSNRRNGAGVPARPGFSRLQGPTRRLSSNDSRDDPRPLGVERSRPSSRRRRASVESRCLGVAARGEFSQKKARVPWRELDRDIMRADLRAKVRATAGGALLEMKRKAIPNMVTRRSGHKRKRTGVCGEATPKLGSTLPR